MICLSLLTRSGAIVALALALALAAAALSTKPLCAQEVPKPDEEDNRVVVEVPRLGMEAFRYLLYQAGVDPIANLVEEVGVEPQKIIIILMGPKSIDQFLTNSTLQAVADGASILIASDKSPTTTYLSAFHVRITGEDVNADPTHLYNGWNFYPYVLPLKFPGRLNPALPESIFDEFDDVGPNAIATNYPSVLQTINPQPFVPRYAITRSVLASFPNKARIFDGVNQRKFDPNRDFFAMGGGLLGGRFLVLADQSVFFNRMVLKEDNANVAFTLKCIAWLQGPEKKTRCLFVEDGVVQTEFNLPIPPTAIPPFPWLEMALRAMMVLEKHGDAMVADLEERDYFNRMMLSHVSRREIVRGVVIVITVLLLLVGFYRFTRSRIGPDPARTLVTPELAALIPRGNVLQQRFEGLLASDNVWEAARQLVRDFLAGLHAEPLADGQQPRLEIQPGSPDEGTLRQQITRLWQIGYGAEPQTVKSEEWPKLAEDLKNILDAADAGKWKFVR